MRNRKIEKHRHGFGAGELVGQIRVGRGRSKLLLVHMVIQTLLLRTRNESQVRDPLSRSVSAMNSLRLLAVPFPHQRLDLARRTNGDRSTGFEADTGAK